MHKTGCCSFLVRPLCMHCKCRKCHRTKICEHVRLGVGSSSSVVGQLEKGLMVWLGASRHGVRVDSKVPRSVAVRASMSIDKWLHLSQFGSSRSRQTLCRWSDHRWSMKIFVTLVTVNPVILATQMSAVSPIATDSLPQIGVSQASKQALAKQRGRKSLSMSTTAIR